MRPLTVRDGVISLLADQHWWTAGELSDCLDVYTSSVRRVLRKLEEQGAVERFDDDLPVMYGWFTARMWEAS